MNLRHARGVFTWVLIGLCLVLCSSSLSAAERTDTEFVTVRDGKLYLGEDEFRAVGACLYLAHNGNYEYITRTIREAKSNGITVIRAVDILQSTYSKPLSDIYSEEVWRRVDWIIKVCADNDMKIFLDIATLKHALYYQDPHRDGYDPAEYATWDEYVDFITSRVNYFTKVTYRDDPTIAAFIIGGEPIPYGGELNTWPNGYLSARNVDDIENCLLHVAASLRAKDPNHLISAGGLLHISKDSGGTPPLDRYGRQYYETIWSDPNIDFGALHIYTTPPNAGGAGGEWNNLEKYVEFCASLGKPLVIEEFGLNANEYSREIQEEFFAWAYDRMYEAGIPVSMFWNWAPAATYDLFSYRTSAMEIIRNNAKRWGYEGEFSDLALVSIDGTPFKDFEGHTEGFRPSVNDPGYGGALSASQDRATSGSYSLKVPVNFTKTYGWYWIDAYTSPFVAKALDVSDADYIAADVWIPADTDSMKVGFRLDSIEQTTGGKQNNYLIPGQWTTVYANLKNPDTQPEGSDWGPYLPAFGKVSRIGLVVLNGNVTFTGDIYIDNLRVGKMVGEMTAEEATLDPDSAGTVSAEAVLSDEVAVEAAPSEHVNSFVGTSFLDKIWPTSVDTMKESKDSCYNRLSRAQIEQVCQLTADMGVTHIALSTPYDFPDYLRQWVQAVRKTGKNVWFRSTFSRWEGIYEHEGNPTMTPSEYIAEFKAFVLANRDLFQPGDILDPCPEPEQPMGNPGKLSYWEKKYGRDWTWRDGGYTEATTEFSQFFVDLTRAANEALAEAGIKGVITNIRSVGDYIAWRPETLYQSALSEVGVVTVDLYPAQDRDVRPATMLQEFQNTLNRIHEVRGLPVIVGEFGYSLKTRPFVSDQRQQAVLKPVLDWVYDTPWIEGFNYWHGAGYPYPSTELYRGTDVFTGNRGAWRRRPAANDLEALYRSVADGVPYKYTLYDFEDSSVDGWQGSGFDKDPEIATDWQSRGEYSIRYDLTLKDWGAWYALKHAPHDLSRMTDLTATVRRSESDSWGDAPVARLYVKTGPKWEWHATEWTDLTTSGSVITLDLQQVPALDDVKEIGVQIGTSTGTREDAVSVYIDDVSAHGGKY